MGSKKDLAQCPACLKTAHGREPRPCPSTLEGSFSYTAYLEIVVPEGKKDVHGDYGAYCYKNFRHSLCHGWSSGPCPYLTRFVLGIKALSADTYEIKPNLADLEWAKGTYPTPFGTIEVSVKKNADGTTKVDVKAPEKIKIVK